MSTRLVEAAIASHGTSTDTDSSWDGGKARRGMAAEAGVLKYCHAWIDPDGESDAKASYKFPHHTEKGGAAIIAGVNNALARLASARIPAEDKKGVERHLRRHRKDAGLSEAMSDAESIRSVNAVSHEDYLEGDDFMAMLEAVREQEGAVRSESDVDDTTGAKQYESAAVKLSESLVVNKDGTINLCIITPGWGNSGYYGAEVLKDAKDVFTKGLQQFWDHPTVSEEFQRPERSLRDLAAVLASSAEWNESGFNGPGLYAKSKVFEPYVEALKEMAPHIGVSVVIFGMSHTGEVDGTQGDIIDKIVAARSVDFVTLPARGGKIEAKFESFRESGRKATEEGEEGSVDEKEAQQLKESNTQLTTKLQESENKNKELTTENSRLKEALGQNLAERFVNKVLSAVKGIPQKTKDRLAESLSKEPIITDDGKLDEDKMKTKIEESVKAEAKYLADLGFGKVTDNGRTGPDDDDDDDDEGDYKSRMESSFKSLGLTDDQVKTAVAGR